ncbi:MAG: undecaprenyldiphospho-muramoylpentapeptide beta-N-acetylglucosaminyltransferase [Alphaproteobacteria bacterium]|nr:undecaprenyldiphospho-muramoylpentapeptide beta-N-acetylglucosaminyltransferase [Alphaproteobacteria bacterium]
MLSDRVIIAAGGTGGHAFPAVCLARELEARGYGVLFATDVRGTKYLGKYQSSAVIQKVCTSSRIKLYISLLCGIASALPALRKMKPRAVVGFGGYPSVPFVLAAQLLGIKTFIHEQNAVIGKANKLLSKLATRICISFPGTRGISDCSKAVCIGNPTRFDAQYGHIEPPQNDVPVVLVFAGSQGARVFSEEVTGALCDVVNTLKIRVFHQGRADDVEKIRQAYAKHNVNATVAPFFENIGELYSQADLVISRSGASSIFEIMGFRKPSVLIPFAKSINGDQLENAQFLEKQEAATLVSEAELSQRKLSDIVKDLLLSENKRLAMSEKLEQIRVSYEIDPAKKFADVITETI